MNNQSCELLVYGFTHQSTPIAVREKIAIAPEQMNQTYSDLVDGEQIRELVIVSTCNRTEFYVLGNSSPVRLIKDWLCRHRDVLHTQLDTAIELSGDHACRHLLRVASGLDSMVLGEPQIFGQIKSAFHVAEKNDAVGEGLRQLFQFSFTQVKAIRSNIPLGQEPVSMAYTAIQLVRQIFERLDDKRLMLIGSGETVELVARYLVDAGVREITIANRTLERAEQLALNYGANAIPLYSIDEYLPQCDIVITATASQLPIVGKGVVEQVMKKKVGESLLLLDLAVPRDIEPQAGLLDDVYLYSVDDFRVIIERSQGNRQQAAGLAQQRVDEIISLYHQQTAAAESVRAVVPFRNQAEDMRDEEVEKAMRRLRRGVMPEAVLYGLAHGLTNKLLHTPSVRVRQAGAEGRHDLVDAAREIFKSQDYNDLSH